MSSDQSLSISRRDLQRIGSAAGESVANQLQGQFEQLNTTLMSVEAEMEGLQSRLASLENQIVDIERTKAEAQRSAIEGHVEQLEQQLREKKEIFEERLGELLNDYRDRVERLKDRFIESISGSDQFEEVEEEFQTFKDRRQTVTATVGSMDRPAVSNYQRRLDAIIDNRNDFLTAIDDFLEDREETAATIDSLQTGVSGISGATRIHVPFWVVGIERDGREEIRVLPVQSRGDPQGTPSREAPRAEYLTEHETHSYGAMSDTVHSYVTRDAVRDSLAETDDEFADARFLRHLDGVSDRFVDAFEEFELRERQPGRPQAGGEAEQAEQAVSTDD